MPRIIGLTGGIATGKSTVSAHWRSRGATIIDADAIARAVVRPGHPSYYLIRLCFGNAVLRPAESGGGIDRRILGTIIFSNPERRRTLNLCTHPFILLVIVFQLFVALVLKLQPLVILDVALLFETPPLLRLCSRVVVVSVASPNIQLQRLLHRDAGPPLHLTEPQARQRILAQMPLHEKRRRAHIVIDNDHSLQHLYHAADDVYITLIPPRLQHSIFRLLVVLFWCKLASLVMHFLGS